MKTKNSLSVERMIELEHWLYNSYSQYLGMNSFDNFSLIEMDYLHKAYYMPYSIVSDYIDTYDKTVPKMDELNFLGNLQKEFVITNIKDIIERIRNVRRIKNYYLQHDEVSSIPTTKKYDKLVRDNIPDIIIENGEEPFTRVLTDEEYWDYLLKKDEEELKEVQAAENKKERKGKLADKLELIRAMAEFSGFSLDDIIAEADRKKQKNGGFEKRLLLERVIKRNPESSS